MKARLWVTVLLLCVISTPPLQAVDSGEATSDQGKDKKLTVPPKGYYLQVTEACVYKSPSGESLPYRLFVPKGLDAAAKVPLLLVFHGAGERGKDNIKQLQDWVAGWTSEEVQSKHPCIILMPQCPGNEQWVNTPWKEGSYSLDKIPVSASMKLATELFYKILEEKPVDKSRIYIMGASMGGFGTWDFIMRHPEIPAAAAPVCGAGDPSKAGLLTHLPIWTFHGDKDTTVPFAGSEDMISAIQKAGGTKAKFTVYRNVRHDSYNKAWKEVDLVDWMFTQKK